MMKFTNPDALSATADRLNLAGWYAQDSNGDYLGVLQKTGDIWYIGFDDVAGIKFPLTIDRIPS